MAQQGSKQTFAQFYGCTPEQAAADLASRNKQAKLEAARDAVIRAAKARIRADNKLGLHKVALEDRVWSATIKLMNLEGK